MFLKHYFYPFKSITIRQLSHNTQTHDFAWANENIVLYQYLRFPSLGIFFFFWGSDSSGKLKCASIEHFPFGPKDIKLHWKWHKFYYFPRITIWNSSGFQISKPFHIFITNTEKMFYVIDTRHDIDDIA